MRENQPADASEVAVAETLRSMVMGIAAAVFAITPVELWLGEHTGGILQLVPFGLCAIGFAAIALMAFRPGRISAFVLRIVMAVVVAGTLFGMYKHLEGNFEFERDIRPNSSSMSAFRESVHGAAPLLAPGILALGAALAVVATWRHPALTSDA